MSGDEVRLATRAELVRAAYGLDAAAAVERVVEHGDFAVAFTVDGVDVFRFANGDVNERWSCR